MSVVVAQQLNSLLFSKKISDQVPWLPRCQCWVLMKGPTTINFSSICLLEMSQTSKLFQIKVSAAWINLNVMKKKWNALFYCTEEALCNLFWHQNLEQFIMKFVCIQMSRKFSGKHSKIHDGFPLTTVTWVFW